MAPAAAPLNILVVDDDPIQRAMAAYYLEKHGAAVKQAEDGAKGLEALAKGCFDIMLTDVDMPNLNGMELLNEVRADPKNDDMMIVVVTSRTDVSEFRAKHRGAEFIKRKPVNWHSLADELGKAYRARLNTAA